MTAPTTTGEPPDTAPSPTAGAIAGTEPAPAMTYAIALCQPAEPGRAPVLEVKVGGRASVGMAREMFTAVAQEAERVGSCPILWDFRATSYDDLAIDEILQVAAAFPASLKVLSARGALLVRQDRGTALAQLWKEISRITLDLEREIFHDRDAALAWASAAPQAKQPD